MKKRKIHIFVSQNGNIFEYNVLGKYDNNIIKYSESKDCLYNITIDINNKILIEDNYEYTITFYFEKDKYDILLKENNGIDSMEIEVKRFEFKNNKLSFEYNIPVTNDNWIYEIEIGD